MFMLISYPKSIYLSNKKKGIAIKTMPKGRGVRKEVGMNSFSSIAISLP